MTKTPTRERLTNAALSLFQRQGYYGTGTQEILELAKAPRGSLYHHFPGGKTDLAVGCVNTVTASVIQRIQALRLEGKQPVEVVETIAHEIANWLEQTEWKEGLLLPTLVHEFSARNDKMRHVIQDAYISIQNEFVQMFVVDGMPEDLAKKAAQRVMAISDGATGLARALESREPLTGSINWRDVIYSS